MYKDGAQILRKQILYAILNIASFLLSEWREAETQKSRFKYEIKFDLYYKLRNKKKILKKN